MVAKRKEPECAYCGGPYETDDHIPPKALIPPEARNTAGFVHVPACLDCHGPFSKDDEYLMQLALAIESEKSQDAKGVTEKVLRWKKHPHKRGLWKSLVSSTRPALIQVSGQLVPTLSFRMKKDRVMTSACRLIRALYYDVTKRRVPDGFQPVAWPLGDLEDIPEIVATQRLLTEVPPHPIGNDAFTYRFRMFSQLPGYSVWSFDFFRGVRVMGLTAEQDEKYTTLYLP